MKSATFGSYLKQVREQKNIPQRIVAHRLDIDTSTLSKIELGERQITINMIVGLSEVLDIEFKNLQIQYISEKIRTDYKDQPFLMDALQETINHIKK